MLPIHSKSLARRSPAASPACTGRRAFTLIELLVVVTIIAILMTLVVRVVGGLISQGRDAATKTTISKIQSLLNSRAQAFDRLMKRNGYLAGTPEYQIAGTLAGGSSDYQNVLARKLLLVKYFPQSSAELADNSVGTRNMANLYPKLFSGGQPNANADSSEILYDFLTQENVLGDTPVGTDAFSAAEVQDTDGDGLPEFVDGWGHKLRFYRWPTRLFNSQGQNANGTMNAPTAADIANASVLLSTLPSYSGNVLRDIQRDPDDPLQLCRNGITINANTSIFENYQFPSATVPLGNQTTPFVYLHTPATYHVFLVISCGPDGTGGTGPGCGLGIYEPDDLANNGHLGAAISGEQDALTDNIVSLGIRAGGK
jgi:prepilin-type N-terminal cleavage/methylation domain-containing protein